jgi:sec-independent protein translocase protein TatB
MFNIGTPELLLILLLAFIVFGPKQLPRLAKGLGKLIGQWRKLTGDFEKTMEDAAGTAEIAAGTAEIAAGTAEIAAVTLDDADVKTGRPVPRTAPATDETQKPARP